MIGSLPIRLRNSKNAEEPLTPRQLAVLATIIQQTHRQGITTIRSIGKALGIRSVNGVFCHLLALERKGFITHKEFKAATVRSTYRLELFPEAFGGVYEKEKDDARKEN